VTSRRAFWIVGLLALAAGAGYLASEWSPGAGRRGQVLRPPLDLPSPSRAEKAAYFFRQMQGGQEIDLGGRRETAWRVVGRQALLDLGPDALDYLLAPGRYPRYVAAPNLLANVLELLPHFPEAGSNPLLFPFLVHWLDPANCPRTVHAPADASNWAEDLRLLVFQVYAHFPDVSALPACKEELERTRRIHDLRAAAIDLFLMLRRPEPVRNAYPNLPPNAAEPNPPTNLRLLVLRRLLAFSTQEDRKAEARTFAPLLHRVAREAPVDIERITAKATLLHLGEAKMEAALISEFERLRPENRNPWAAWEGALAMLAREKPLPYVKRVCLKRLKTPDNKIGFLTAPRLLCYWWLDDPAVRSKIWELIRKRQVFAPNLLQHLARVDRAGVVAYLRAEIASGESDRIQTATRFALRHPIPEVGPALFDLVLKIAPDRRPFLYKAMAKLHMRRAVPLLIAELEGAATPLLRDAAATELLNMHAGTEVLAKALRRGDRAVLGALARRAQGAGRRGVPEALVGPVLRCLRDLPGESDRLTALWVLRLRGSLQGVRGPLLEAYREEPSRRVAREIRETLVELAHR